MQIHLNYLGKLLDSARAHRQSVVLCIDAILIALAWHATYFFRMGYERWLHERPAYDWAVLFGVIFIYSIASFVMKVPKAAWKYVSLQEVSRLLWVCGGAGLLSAVCVLMAQLEQVPRAVLALHPLFSFMLLMLVRVLWRMLHEKAQAKRSLRDVGERYALVLGAGAAAKLLIAGIQHRGWSVRSLLDDDVRKHHTRVAGIPVLGGLDRLSEASIVRGITDIILAMPSASGMQRKRALDLAAKTGLPVVTVPSADELREGRSRIDRIRDIEPEDLLAREPVHLDESGLSDLINGQVVMVTGAGGSIGSELCLQIARFGPIHLVLFDLSEVALYQIEQDLGDRFPQLGLVRLLGDVKDTSALRRAMNAHRPDVLFHAAAFKHVPLMEDHNAWAAFRNNTLGTHLVAQVAAEYDVGKFVLISTDKAVNPTNVMGATKRAAEMVIAFWAKQNTSTCFLAVRFGNVLGSSGSVIPKFKEQISRGGPLTVTHPDITRFFMTIPEAAQLVLQSAVLAKSGQVFVMDMGQPVKIVDLARELIRLSGHLEAEIPIVFSGLRPGEKLFEELLADADKTLPTPHPRLRLAQLSEVLPDEWMQHMQALAADESAAQPDKLKLALQQLVPEYQPRFC